MGTCWPKLKLKTTHNKNYSNHHNETKNKKQHKTVLSQKKDKKDSSVVVVVSSKEHQSPNFEQQNHEITTKNSKKLITLQPRRDLENSIVTNVMTTSSNSSNTTTTSNFKQFCRNSADRLTHKLSFTHHHNHINPNESKIINLFDKYKDTKDCMLANGIQQFCDDLSLKPDDFKILLLAWKLNAKQMCKFTRDEFLNGFKYSLKVDNLKDLKLKLTNLEEDMKKQQQNDDFKDLYRWSFDFGLDSDTGERSIPIEMAISLWQLVYINQEPAILNRWLTFLKEHPSVKGIPRDTWNMFPLFAKSIGEFNYHLYDDNEAWPCLFDDFVQSESTTTTTSVKLDINNNSDE